jgi:hypothetical protein
VERLENATKKWLKKLASGPEFEPRTSRVWTRSAAYNGDCHTFSMLQRYVPHSLCYSSTRSLCYHPMRFQAIKQIQIRCSIHYARSGDGYLYTVIKILLVHLYPKTDSKMISRCALGQQGSIHFMNGLKYVTGTNISKLVGNEISSTLFVSTTDKN